MRIRFTLSHSDGEKNVLELDQVNPELSLEVPSDKDIFWVSCDDDKTLTRYVFKIQKEEEYFRIYYKGSSSSYYYLKDLQKIAYNSVKQNVDSYLISDFSYEKGLFHKMFKFFA